MGKSPQLPGKDADDDVAAFDEDEDNPNDDKARILIKGVPFLFVKCEYILFGICYLTNLAFTRRGLDPLVEWS